MPWGTATAHFFCVGLVCRKLIECLGSAIAHTETAEGDWVFFIKGHAMIRHTVAFKLKHPPASDQESSFLEAAQALASIPGVQSFECLRQVSPKNGFSFGLSMEFDSPQAYSAYNLHADHVRFVESRRKPEVADFLEIDYVPLRSV